MNKELADVLYYDFMPGTFEKLLFDAIIKLFKPHIRKNYQVVGFAKMHDYMYTVKLKKIIHFIPDEKPPDDAPDQDTDVEGIPAK